jgi:hypothetical protein
LRIVDDDRPEFLRRYVRRLPMKGIFHALSG